MKRLKTVYHAGYLNGTGTPDSSLVLLPALNCLSKCCASHKNIHTYAHAHLYAGTLTHSNTKAHNYKINTPQTWNTHAKKIIKNTTVANPEVLKKLGEWRWVFLLKGGPGRGDFRSFGPYIQSTIMEERPLGPSSSSATAHNNCFVCYSLPFIFIVTFDRDILYS